MPFRFRFGVQLAASPGREQRRLAALRVAGDQEPLADLRGHVPRRAHDVEDASALGLADEVRVRPRRAEPLVVGANDRVAGVDPGIELGVDICDEASAGRRRDLARARRCQRCPWCRGRRMMTGQPPFGGLPLGMLTAPETASSAPCGVRECRGRASSGRRSSVARARRRAAARSRFHEDLRAGCSAGCRRRARSAPAGQWRCRRSRSSRVRRSRRPQPPSRPRPFRSRGRNEWERCRVLGT